MTNPARSSNEKSNNLYRLSSGKIGKLDHRSKNIRRNGRPGGRRSDASSSSAFSFLVLITSRRLIQFKSLIFLILILQLFWLIKVYHHRSSSPLQPLDQNLKSHPYLFPQLRHERQQQSSLLSLQSSYSSPIGYTKITSSTRRLDIGVPVSGKAEAMDRFAKLFSQAMYDLRHNVDKGRFVQVRLILSRNAGDDMSWEYRQRLKMHSGVDDVIFATEQTPSTKFSRAKAINTISKFACQQQQQTTDTLMPGTNSTANETSSTSLGSTSTKGSKACVLGIVDVDMQVGVEFLVNSLNHVSPTNVYFPVVFSNYRPSNVALVEAFAGHPLEPFSEDTGWWRDHGYGMYSIYGTGTYLCMQLCCVVYVLDILKQRQTLTSLCPMYLIFDFLSLNYHTDIFKVTMNATKFQGWGKEDGDFYTRVINSPRKFNVIRWKEPGLIHLWHPKVCLYVYTCCLFHPLPIGTHIGFDFPL